MDDPTWRQVDAPDESWPEIPLMAVGTRAKRSIFDRNRHQRLTAMRAFLQRSGPPDANLKSGQHTRDPAEAMAEALTPKGKNGAPFFSREERAISQHRSREGPRRPHRLESNGGCGTEGFAVGARWVSVPPRTRWTAGGRSTTLSPYERSGFNPTRS